MVRADGLRRAAERPDSEWIEASDLAGQGVTVHVVGRMTPPLTSFLLPAIQAMHAAAVPQALIFIDDAAGYAREQVAALPPGVARVPVADGVSPWARSRSLSAGLQAQVQRGPIGVLHLYGLLPGLVALRLMRSGPRREIPVYFSPHSSRGEVRPSPVRALAGRLLRRGLGPNADHAIVNLRLHGTQMAPFDGLRVQVVECPVPAVFFDTPRHEAKRPLLISCNLEGQRAALDGFLRIAVLLNDERLGISFNWVGPAGPEAAAAIRASGIGQFDAASDAARAQRMAAAWVYVAASEERGFPVRLAEAMAAGLPCVALDSEVHRSMITDGRTGYLCSDLKQLLLRVGQLVDSPELRGRMGRAARDEAAARFSEGEFRRQLWRAIGDGHGVQGGAAVPAPPLAAGEPPDDGFADTLPEPAVAGGGSSSRASSPLPSWTNPPWR